MQKGILTYYGPLNSITEYFAKKGLKTSRSKYLSIIAGCRRDICMATIRDIEDNKERDINNKIKPTEKRYI